MLLPPFLNWIMTVWSVAFVLGFYLALEEQKEL